MNILKPQKIVYEELKIIENFQEEIKEKDEFENIIIQNYKEKNIRLNDITIKKSIINNVELTNSKLEKNTFIDIQFNNCNSTIISWSIYKYIFLFNYYN